MNSNQNPTSSEAQPRSRKLRLWASAFVALLFAGSELAALLVGGSHQAWVLLPVFIIVLAAFWLIGTGRQIQGSLAVIAAIGLQSILLPLVERNASFPGLIISLAMMGGTCLATLPRQYFGRVLGGSLFVSIVSLLIDVFGSPSRPEAEFGIGRWIFLSLILVAFTALLIREFQTLDIRTKIVTGILGTGGLALAMLIFFAINQTQQVTNALSARLEAKVTDLAQEQLRNTAFEQARSANQTFEDVTQVVTSLAQTWSLLQDQTGTLNQAPYWDASTHLIQMPEGQYRNSTSEPASVFVPTGIKMDEELIRDLNVMAYLDFDAPQALKAIPSLRAVFAVDTRGITRYYPNIDLASLVRADFNPALQRPYYRIVTPLYDAQRQPKWAIPYVDAAGGGLVVTVAAPVYQGDQFRGIVAADMELSGITEQINSIKVGKTGYAYLLNNDGQILSMPDAGLKMFGLDPEALKANPEEFYKDTTVLGRGTVELQAVTKRMTSGGNGLLVAKVDGVDTYISFAYIPASGYSVALVVPVSELQGESIAARNLTNEQIQNASRQAIIIVIILLILAVVVSLGLGQIITAPIRSLTQVAAQIAGGDISVQASAATKDEIGTLANSFNTMTSRLRETLDGLERMVEERTGALLSANERNERRARQFESIAQVARTISSTRDLDVLLSQITTVISREFNFYHVGIFLLDTAKEYAILSAANSEGGQVMLRRGHRLKVGETGIVGYVTGTGDPRVALDTGADAVFFNNPDLPNTRSEIALPLRSGEEIIGALDVQSTEPGAFSQEDISILSTLADQVSIALQNARQFEQTHKALSEAEALAKQFAKTGWQQFTKDKSLVGIHHTGVKATLLYEQNDQKQEEDSLGVDQSRPKSRGLALSLPIQLRGEVIGSVNVRSADNHSWEQDELDIITAITERAAIAMENARLLEESQRLASKEAKIGAVTAKISASINMRNVLQTAVEELGHALPGSEIVIQFQTDQNKNKTTS